MKIDKMWAIYNPRTGFYCGTWLRRRDAIHEHIKYALGDWIYCRNKGDKVVKVAIVPWEIWEQLDTESE